MSGDYVNEERISSTRLINTLEASELRVLVALVRGMSAKDTAAATGMKIDEVERARTSMMKKLGANRAADAVRIGLYARVDLLH